MSRHAHFSAVSYQQERGSQEWHSARARTRVGTLGYTLDQGAAHRKPALPYPGPGCSPRKDRPALTLTRVQWDDRPG